MTFQEYQLQSRKTALYTQTVPPDKHMFYIVLGLVGESGEIAEKLKKNWRDHAGVIDENQKQELIKELGDVLWYMAQLATELGTSLDEVAWRNIEKLFSRKDRGALHGSGDNR